MSNPLQLVGRFLGGDPAAGASALSEILALGDRGEDALFAGPIAFPNLFQVRRRWLRYVAARGDSVAARLLERLAHQERFKDAHAAAYLCAGVRSPASFRDAFYDQLEAGFTHIGYYDSSSRYTAWGYAGGSAAMLLDIVSRDHFKWEKLRSFAFRAGCASCARVNRDDFRTLEWLVTREWHDYEGLVEIPNDPDRLPSHSAIDDSELWGQANDSFLTWRRGDVADEVLRRCPSHPHWRVRCFGAQILASFGFQRTVTPIVGWLRREPVASIRGYLLNALERTATEAGADVLLAFYAEHGEGRPYVAKAAWRGTDKRAAVEALRSIASGTEDSAAAEALVSLARLGAAETAFTSALDGNDDYLRLCGALALAYAGDRSVTKRLVAMQGEAATPFERVGIAAALAILGQPNAAERLHAEIVAASEADYPRRADVFLLHRFLQEALQDGLAAGGAQTMPALEAWRAEFEPLEPVASVPAAVAVAVAAPEVFPALAPSQAPTPAATACGAGPESLKVFVSYSHRDERMRRKLGEHLAPLVTQSLIRIWYDREIEAGADWEGEINREIDDADLVLLLVSSTFLESEYCRKELLRALEGRKAGKASTVPIILRPCDWQSVFNATDYKAQALPRDDRPIAGGKWPNQDAAFAEVAREIRSVVERLRRLPREQPGA